jgi:hypothetical protein
MADPASKFPSLTVLGGEKAGTQFLIEETVDNILIGSDPSCRFCLSSPGVSPVHARIWVDENGLTLYDTHSPRGLYVNDDKVTGQTALHNGDIIWLGSPGDDQAVMIQCRVPPRETAVEATPAAPEATQATEPPPAPMAPQTLESQTLALPRDEFIPAQPEPVEDSDFAAPEAPEEVVPAIAAPRPAESVTEIEETQARPVDVVHVPPARPVPESPPTPRPAPPSVVVPAVPRPTAPAPIPRSGLTPVPGAQQAARPHPPRVAHVTPVPGAARRSAPSAAAAQAHSAPRAPKSGSKTGLWIAVVVLAVLGAAGAAGYFYLGGRPSTVAQTTPTPLPPTPVPTTEPTVEATLAPVEVPTAAPTPEPVEVVTIVKPTTSPTPKGTPSPTKTPKPTPTVAGKPTPPTVQGAAQASTRVAGLISQAEAAVAADRFDTAVGLYDEVLKLEATNAKAAAGRSDAAAAAASLKRTFVVGRTSVQAGKGGSKNLQGFESEGVTVAKAPDYSGVLDFDVSPAHVKAGTNLAIRVRLANDGKKAYRVASIEVATTVNGERSSTGATPPPRDIEPKQNVNVVERSVVWAGTTRSWQLEITVKTTRGDSFTNRVTWR